MRRGFTLLEMLVVMAIIGILIGICSLSLGHVYQEHEKTQIKADMGVLQFAAESALANGESDLSQERLIQHGYLQREIRPIKADMNYVIEIVDERRVKVMMVAKDISHE